MDDPKEKQEEGKKTYSQLFLRTGRDFIRALVRDVAQLEKLYEHEEVSWFS